MVGHAVSFAFCLSYLMGIGFYLILGAAFSNLCDIVEFALLMKAQLGFALGLGAAFAFGFQYVWNRQNWSRHLRRDYYHYLLAGSTRNGQFVRFLRALDGVQFDRGHWIAYE